MKITVRYQSPIPSYKKPTGYLLGNGMKTRVEISFLPIEFEAFFDSEFGSLKYEYMASGGWQSNKKAMTELSQIMRLGLKIGVVYITANYPTLRCTNARTRFARYKQSGVSIKTAKNPVV